jgi:aspartate/methionine/tyrosine aminotransferase
MIVQPSNRVSKVETYYFAEKLAEIGLLNKKGMDIINLGIGSPDLDPPREVIDILSKAVQAPNVHSYQSYKGIQDLRDAYASFYQMHYDVSLDPDNEILPLIGSKEGIVHISMAFLNEGDGVLIPDPGYPTYASATKLAGGIPMTYNLTAETDWLPDLKALEKEDLSEIKLMWINYPHMPTGKRPTERFFDGLVAFAQKHKILLCHDNPYNFILNDDPISIMSTMGSRECCLELLSLSKSFNMAGWRVGAVVGAQPYIDTVMRFKSNMDSGMFRPVQEAACAALRQKKDWFRDLNIIYTERRKKAWAILDILDCEYDTDAAGMFVWAKPKGNKDVKKWIDEILYEAKVFITPGFIFGQNGNDYIRISLCADLALFDNAISRIAVFVGQKELVT